MRPLMDSAFVGIGAMIGANARYWIGYFAKSTSLPFPWHTLFINVLGSALLGAFTAAALIKGWGNNHRLFFAVGLCGGFTTFSTFSFEIIDLYYRKSWKMAALYMVLSFVLGVGACFLGGHVARNWAAKQL